VWQRQRAGVRAPWCVVRPLEMLFLFDNRQLSGQEALRLHLEEHNPGCDFMG
jgi:hypothetical protein